MKRCPQCQNDDLLDSAAFCSHCGADLDRPAESHTSDYKEQAVETAELADDSRLAEPMAGSRFDDTDEPAHHHRASEVRGMDEENLSAQSESLQAEIYGSMAAEEAMDPAPAPAPAHELSPTDSQGIRKLSSKEIEDISASMYGGQSSRPYLSDDEKRNLLKSITKTGGETAAVISATAALAATKTAKPAVPERPDPVRPKMADRLRGVSYFAGNFIYLSGNQRLHEQDELSVGDRVYVLRKKRLSPKAKWITIGSSAGVVLLLFFIFLFARSGSGNGTVIGVVLDATQQPYIQGAEIRFPDQGTSIKSNGQGFFVADGIASGSHKIEYVVNDQVVGTDYATVVSGEVTTIALKPTELSAGDAYATQTQEEIPALNLPNATDVAQPVYEEPQHKQAAAQVSSNAQLALSANVNNASLQIDGQPVGAGNLTYQKLRPGRRSYVVSADGYKPAAGTILLSANKTAVLEVALEPIPVQQQESAEDLAYRDAEATLNAGQFEAAAARFADVINMSPNSWRAYLGRAQAYEKANNQDAAVADYIQGGTLALQEGNHSQAYQAYDRACQLDRRSAQAWLGRATTNLVRGQDLAAVADYETVLSLDRNSVQAYMGIGEARYNLGNYKEAIQNFKSARDLEPNNTEIYEYLMLSYLGDNDIKDVRKTFEKYKRMVGEDQLARMGREEKYRLLMQVVSTGN